MSALAPDLSALAWLSELQLRFGGPIDDEAALSALEDFLADVPPVLAEHPQVAFARGLVCGLRLGF